jgi:hypothetical protein
LSNSLFNLRDALLANDGHIRGETIWGLACKRASLFWSPAGFEGFTQCPNFSNTRCMVLRSNRGGRVPMVLTHSTLRRGSIWAMRCWELEGWRPQSSENTTIGSNLFKIQRWN